MEPIPAWKGTLAEAKKHFQIADHMAYVTFTLLKENRLIIKILVETAEATGLAIKAILQKKLSENKIKVYADTDKNLQIFLEKIASEYIDNKDIQNIAKIMEIRKKHINAPVEFVRKDKFVILLGDKYESLTIEYVKELMNSARRLVSKVSLGL